LKLIGVCHQLFLSPEDLGNSLLRCDPIILLFDEKKEKGKKDEVHDEERVKDNSKNTVEKEK